MDVLERGPLLSQLATRLSEARRGRGHVVMVVGEAGIGKSVLVEAFGRHVARGARVLWGACDPVMPARPFAPLVDIGAAADSGLPQALVSGDQTRVYDLFLSALRAPGRPATAVVFEDLHWADDATLDLLRIIGRRIQDLPVLLVGTYRDDDVDPTHPLHLALGDIPARGMTTVRVPPLSPAAVAVLAAGSRHDPGRLHRATAGNPFFVTEILASDGDGLPTTIRDAVVARAARLSPAAQQALGSAAVLGYRCEEDIVRAVAGRGVDGIDECVARGVLRREGQFVVFRHELARTAILDAMPAARRTATHRRALAVLMAHAGRVDAARLVEHADGAGDREAVLALAPVAAGRAEALGAHREAAAQYAIALRSAALVVPRSRAELLEGYARASSLCGEVSAGMEAQERAITLRRALGDAVRAGDDLRVLSSMAYFAGDGERARELAVQAVAVLESVPDRGHELALAYATLAQRLAVAGQDDAEAMATARQALELADRLNDTEVAVHALTTIGVLEIYTGAESGWAKLEDSAERALAAGLYDPEARARINLVEAARDMRRYEIADRYVGLAKEAVRDYDLYHLILRGRIADLDFDRGRWDAAMEEARRLIEECGTATVVRVRALTLVGRCRARRGDPAAAPALEAALNAASPIEVQELAPLYAALAEAAWLTGELAGARTAAITGLDLARRASTAVAPWWWAELAFWAWKSGAIDTLPAGIPEPYALYARASYREAAACWATIGAPYHEAFALAESDDELDLRRALRAAQRLGARPLERRIGSTLRRLGAAHLPRGPRRSTRDNPAGLTAREIDVLALLARQLRNAEIAERLVVSPKTVDHHVSAILRKLNVSSRGMAVEAATRLGLQHGGFGGQT